MPPEPDMALEDPFREGVSSGNMTLVDAMAKASKVALTKGMGAPELLREETYPPGLMRGFMLPAASEAADDLAVYLHGKPAATMPPVGSSAQGGGPALAAMSNLGMMQLNVYDAEDLAGDEVAFMADHGESEADRSSNASMPGAPSPPPSPPYDDTDDETPGNPVIQHVVILDTVNRVARHASTMSAKSLVLKDGEQQVFCGEGASGEIDARETINKYNTPQPTDPRLSLGATHAGHHARGPGLLTMDERSQHGRVNRPHTLGQQLGPDDDQPLDGVWATRGMAEDALTRDATHGLEPAPAFEPTPLPDLDCLAFQPRAPANGQTAPGAGGDGTGPLLSPPSLGSVKPTAFTPTPLPNEGYLPQQPVSTSLPPSKGEGLTPIGPCGLLSPHKTAGSIAPAQAPSKPPDIHYSIVCPDSKYAKVHTIPFTGNTLEDWRNASRGAPDNSSGEVHGAGEAGRARAEAAVAEAKRGMITSEVEIRDAPRATPFAPATTAPPPPTTGATPPPEPWQAAMPNWMSEIAASYRDQQAATARLGASVRAAPPDWVPRCGPMRAQMKAIREGEMPPPPISPAIKPMEDTGSEGRPTRAPDEGITEATADDSAPFTLTWLAIIVVGSAMYILRSTDEARAAALGVAIGCAVSVALKSPKMHGAVVAAGYAAPFSPVLVIILAYFVAGTNGHTTTRGAADMVSSPDGNCLALCMWAAFATVVTLAVTCVHRSAWRGLSAPLSLKGSAVTSKPVAVMTASPAPATAPMGGKAVLDDCCPAHHGPPAWLEDYVTALVQGDRTKEDPSFYKSSPGLVGLKPHDELTTKQLNLIYSDNPYIRRSAGAHRKLAADWGNGTLTAEQRRDYTALSHPHEPIPVAPWRPTRGILTRLSRRQVIDRINIEIEAGRIMIRGNGRTNEGRHRQIAAMPRVPDKRAPSPSSLPYPAKLGHGVITFTPPTMQMTVTEVKPLYAPNCSASKGSAPASNAAHGYGRHKPRLTAL
jgi:hypothetical protein